MTLSVGFLVAYDYKYLEYALPLVYNHCEHIVLTIDKNHLTLTGQKFTINSDFFIWVNAIDVNRKVTWNEEAFFKEGLTPLEVILGMRNSMLGRMPRSDWYIQLDADEYFINFSGFRDWLSKLPPQAGISVIRVAWKTMFKQTKGGFLMVEGRKEQTNVALNIPENTSERNHKDAVPIEAPFYMVHQSWARSQSEVAIKIMNWSHTRDFDTSPFLNFWNGLSHRNYRYVRNFHPLTGPIWPFLTLVPAKDVVDLVSWYEKYPSQSLAAPPLPLWYRLKNKLRRLFIPTT